MEKEKQMQITPEMIANMAAGNVSNVQSLSDIFINNMKGKAAIVTGGASGLGYNVVNRLSEAGVKVVIASRNEKKGKKAEEEFRSRGREVTWCQTDVTKVSDCYKAVEFTENISDVADTFIYLITPKIGARFGAALREIIPAVKRGEYTISGDTLVVGEYVLNSDEFENRLTVRDGVTGAALPDNTAVVVLDTEINSELTAEGLANDALRFIQDTRKAIGLDVSDRINMTYWAEPALANAIELHRGRIMRDALIKNMSQNENGVYNTNIEGYNLSVSIEKVN